MSRELSISLFKQSSLREQLARSEVAIPAARKYRLLVRSSTRRRCLASHPAFMSGGTLRLGGLLGKSRLSCGSRLRMSSNPFGEMNSMYGMRVQGRGELVG